MPVLDREGRPIRPWYHAVRADNACEATLAQGHWQSGRTWCKRRATTDVDGVRLCGHHANVVRRGERIWVDTQRRSVGGTMMAADRLAEPIETDA